MICLLNNYEFSFESIVKYVGLQSEQFVYVVCINTVSKRFRRIYTYSSLEKAEIKFNQIKENHISTKSKSEINIQIVQCQLDNDIQSKTIITTYRSHR